MQRIYRTSDAQCNWWSFDQCPARSTPVVTFLTNFSLVLLYIMMSSLASLCHLFWFCSLSASCELLASSLTRHLEKLKSPWVSVTAAQQQLKDKCVINVIFVLNPKYNTIQAIRKKDNCIPAETRTTISSLTHSFYPKETNKSVLISQTSFFILFK